MISTENITSAFRFEKTLLLYSGIYPIKNNKLFSWFNIGLVINLAIAILQELSMIALLVTNYDNLSEVMQALAYWATHTAFMLKMVMFLAKRNELEKIENHLNDSVIRDACKDHHQDINQMLNPNNKLFSAFRFCCAGCVFGIVVYPFVEQKSSHKSLPLPGYVPFDINQDLYYYMTYVVQVLAIFLGAFSNSAMDIFMCKLMGVTAALFGVLIKKFSSLDYKSQEVEEKLEQYVQFHVEVLRFVSRVEYFQNMILFQQFLVSVCAICTTCFDLNVVLFGSGQFLFDVFYMMAMLCQVGIFCWSGHEIKEKSDSFSTSCYMNKWYHASLKERKTLMIVKERAKSPIVFTAGKIFPLSLTTLVLILRTSYSYFTVLKRYNDK